MNIWIRISHHFMVGYNLASSCFRGIAGNRSYFGGFVKINVIFGRLFRIFLLFWGYQSNVLLVATAKNHLLHFWV